MMTKVQDANLFDIQPVYGKCSDCGRITTQTKLRFLPETEEAIRRFALKKISVDEMNSFNHNMFCRKCFKKITRS